MKRLFYYSGYRLTVFHWINGKFAGNYYFDPTEAGREEFSHYLKKTPPVPSRILVDVIEEDFRIETLPHAYGSDRKALVQRQIERFFRNSGHYVWHEFQGRESSGRRDDRVLFAALTNPDMLKPWLKQIADADVPVRGIWSLPLLSTKILSRLNAGNGNVFLISQQVSSNIRLSHFKNGRLVSSRSTTINLEGTDYGHFISEQIEQTARFLANKRSIGFDEAISIHIIAPEEFFESVQTTCVSAHLRNITVHRTRDIEKKVASQGITGPYGNGIFAQLCSDDHVTRGHYGGTADFSIYNRYLAGKALLGLAAALTLGSLLLASWLYFDSQRMQAESREFGRQTASINSQYQKQLQKLEPVLAQTGLMKASVDLAEKIAASKQISPQHFMTRLSRIFSSNRFNLLRIAEIEWQIVATASEDGELNTLVPVHLQSATLLHQATIKGRVPVSADNIRDAVNQVNQLAEHLREDKQIQNVQIKKLPVDTRSSGRLTLEAGSKAAAESLPEAGEFILSVTMKGKTA
ncbi:MAG: hypothetical protein QG652_57 [Pseudomonadota bacterium]|nr:hypothetical protein [Pseudomonadota bacterium]